MNRDHRIESLIVQLEHGSLAQQQEAARRLAEQPLTSRRFVVSRLPYLNHRGRLALLQRLGGLRDPQLLLPLMQYVFDSRDDLDEADGRAIAMKAIVETVTEGEAKRVGRFAADVVVDRDPFVRGYAITLLARTTGPNAQEIIEASLADEHPFVREQVILAQGSLQNGDFFANAVIQMDQTTLLRHVRGSSGAELEQWLARLRKHPSAVRSAIELVRERGHRTKTGLLLLLEFGDPRARAVACEHVRWTTCADEQAICLRIVAAHLDNDAIREELQAIRVGLNSGDQFVYTAAWNAAGRTGNGVLIDAAIDAAADSDIDIAFAAAGSLAISLRPEQLCHANRLAQSLETVHCRGVEVSGFRWVQQQKLEMLLAIALAQIVGVEQTGNTIRAIREAHQREISEAARARNAHALKQSVMHAQSASADVDRVPSSGGSGSGMMDAVPAIAEIALTFLNHVYGEELLGYGMDTIGNLLGALASEMF
ncbi:MAG: hypothetical protein H0U74_04800 [Bradymonadaceae bacterium]|nr:hypothetical protein [Lujinxingiaceae bacterium]